MAQTTRHPDRPDADRIERILVIRLGALGDVVRTLPAVCALRARHPGSHLTWLVEPASAAVVASSGCVDETLVFPRSALVGAARQGEILAFARQLRAFVRRLRARRFELVVDFHCLLKSGLLAWLSGAPQRLGHRAGVAREGAHLFSNRYAALASSDVSRFERNAALIAALAPDLEVPSAPLLRPSSQASARLEARLREAGRGDARGFVLIHPGSSAGAPQKRYAADAWRAVADRLTATGLDVFVAAGPSPAERALVDAILSGAGPRLVEAPATETFDDLLALIARAGVFAAGDTGPLHAASLSGVPVVQLLGPTDPVHNEPAPASPWRRLHVPLPCSPCRRGCVDASCMRAIAPARVAEAIHALAPEGASRAAARAEAGIEARSDGQAFAAGGGLEP